MTLPHFRAEAGLPETRNGFYGQFQIGRGGLAVSFAAKVKTESGKKDAEPLQVVSVSHLGEVSEWPKEQHWKCCNGLKPVRGFESPPLRLKCI